MTSFAYGAATDVGRVRSLNEDSYFVADAMFVVADGMGGHNGGEIASRIAVDRLATADTVGSIDDLIVCVQGANESIVDRARENPELRGMGTTVTMLADIKGVGPNRIGIANVGDSRLYRVTDEGLHQHTEDHSLVEALVRDGRLTRAEAAVHPQRNIVTRALGIDDRVLVDAWELVPVIGDRFVLCSDGLFGEIHDGEIHEVLQSTPSPQDAAEELVKRACDAGGRDNVTVVVVDVVAADSIDEMPTDRVTDVRKALPGGILAPDEPDDPEPAPAADPQPDPVRVDAAPGIVTWRMGIFITAVVAVVIGMIVVVVAIGRSGYTVVEGDGGTVAIVKGQEDGFLWLDPTLEFESEIRVADLPTADRTNVREGQEFGSRDEADTYLDYLQGQADADGP